MPDRRGSRFALEVLFLAALAAGLAFARLGGPAIVGVMLLGWLLVAGLEWSAWRERPHFGAGLPPRWHVPAVALPPAQPLEQVAPGYPEARRDEAPTWIASAALREELLGEWPIASDEDTQGAAPDPWAVEEYPFAPSEPEPELQPEPEPEPEPAPVVVSTERAPEPEPEPQPSLEVELTESVVAVARHHLDPLAEPERRRRFGRREEPASIEVPARPGRRSLPGSSGGGP